MNTQVVHFVVSFTIHDGKLAAFEGVAQEMIAGSAKEVGTLAYDWYYSSDRTRCRLIERYTDANAVVAHLTGPVLDLVPKLLKAAGLTSFEVYGDPGPKGAEILAGYGADVFSLGRGLTR
jgi:quinol monooxygenase YgiN